MEDLVVSRALQDDPGFKLAWGDLVDNLVSKLLMFVSFVTPAQWSLKLLQNFFYY